MDKLIGYRTLYQVAYEEQALEPLSATVCLHLDPGYLAPRTERKITQLLTGNLDYCVLSQ